MKPYETFWDRHGWLVTAAIVIGVPALCVAVVLTLAALFPSPPSPWTNLGGDVQRRCEGTTALYQPRSGFSRPVTAVAVDPACTLPEETP